MVEQQATQFKNHTSDPLRKASSWSVVLDLAEAMAREEANRVSVRHGLGFGVWGLGFGAWLLGVQPHVINPPKPKMLNPAPLNPTMPGP